MASVLLLAAFSRAGGAQPSTAQPIDRRALVERHNPVVERFDPDSPLSVGNGQFAFTADATGLQTFPEAYEKTIPLGTLSHWGWHTAPNPEGWSIEKYRFTEFDAGGRQIGYADIPGDVRTPEVAWLRANPHRRHLESPLGKPAAAAIAALRSTGKKIRRISEICTNLARLTVD